MYLSKSKYCRGIQCPKMLWMDKYKSEEAIEINNDTVLDNGTEVGEIAKDLFGFHININFNDNLEEMIKDTKSLLFNKNIVITEASFSYLDNFCSVDILRKIDDLYEIYEVKSSTEVKDIYVDDLSYQVYVLSSLGYKVRRACLVIIDSSYVREDKLDIHKLFKVIDYTDDVLSKRDIVEKKIKYIKKYVETTMEQEQNIGSHCFKPYPCPYFKYCSGLKDDNNVFSIRGLSNKKKVELYNKNIISYENILNSNLNDKYKIQVEYELGNREDYIDRDKIKRFLNILSLPLYFLDFETFQEAIPSYKGMHPYEQIPFQYSLHILNTDEVLEHKEFLSEDSVDPRYSLAKQLVRDIPENVCVLAYNMSFERGVIERLAKLYPELKEHLMNIHDNIKDLMIPFYRKEYYTKDMHGSYSIKYVLPALYPNEPSLNYHNLEQVHNGSEASSSFLNMKNLNNEEKLQLRENMLRYCGLDTYAMVKVYEKLKKVVDDKNEL